MNRVLLTRTLRALPLARALAALAAVAALFLMGATTGAQASPSQESTFQDDKLLVYSPPDVVARTLDTLKSLGVARVRVSVFWNVVAPAATSTQKPSFDASDPAAYTPAAWAPYDTLVRLAKDRGIAMYFDVTSPAPYWATGQPPRQDIEKNYYPSPDEYGQFIRALGKRYSGTYVPRVPSSPSDKGPLPRVDYWSFWNEPNQPGWLTPQWVPDPHNAQAQIPASPRIYRSLVDAGYTALSDTGHGQDTILVGETAPKGLNVQGLTRAIKPLAFIRLLYCVDNAYHPLTGQAAADQGCPTSAADSRSFPSAHPGLFKFTGWAHHPYEFTFSPTTVPTDPDYVTIANLPRLSSALSAIFTAYGQSRGIPLYLTEFGYLTKPPSPLGVSLSRQSSYYNQAEFITFNNPNVRTLTQFLLVDDKPKPGVSDPLQAYGGTFQTGLEFDNGRKKPGYYSYRLPIFLPSSKVKRGHALRVWGLVRPAAPGTATRVAIQFAKGKGKKKKKRFKTVKVVTTQTAHAYLYVRVHVRGTGGVRLAWTDPATHEVEYSRTAAVRVH